MNAGTFHECKAILFDFGGTLDSDGEHWLDRFYALYQHSELSLPLQEIKRAFYHADRLCSGDSQLAAAGLRPLMQYHVHLQFEALNIRDTVKEKELVEGFCARSEWFLRRNARLLAIMRPHFKLGLVSNFYGNVSTLCKEAGLAAHFDVMLDSAQVGIGKPDPDIFRMALTQLDLPPARSVFVGDSYERDMIPAREVGMKTIWLKGPDPRIPPNAGPVDACILSLMDLQGLIP